MKKDVALIGGLFLVVIALLFFGDGFTSTGLVGRSSNGESTTQASLGEQVDVKIRDFSLKVAVADTDSERKLGLSGRDGLPLNWGLLFVFEQRGPHAIWMKDMRFAIDVIWVDEDKRIIDMESNVTPEPNKKDKELTIYRPAGDARYILEINAGLSSLNGLQVGDIVEF